MVALFYLTRVIVSFGNSTSTVLCDEVRSKCSFEAIITIDCQSIPTFETLSI